MNSTNLLHLSMLPSTKFFLGFNIELCFIEENYEASSEGEGTDQLNIPRVKKCKRVGVRWNKEPVYSDAHAVKAA